MVGPSASLRKVEDRSCIFLNQEDRIPEGSRSINFTFRNLDISDIHREDETSRFEKSPFQMKMHRDLIEGGVTS